MRLIHVERASTYSYLCTIHPGGAVGLDALPRNSWLRTLTPLLLGVPIGGVLAIGVGVADRLDTA